MTSILAQRPGEGEHADYFSRYIQRTGDGDILRQMEEQAISLSRFFQGLEAKADHRYAAGKWSLREIVGHLSDTERVLVYRALRFARGDGTPLAGFDENDYVARAGFSERPLGRLVEEWESVRAASLTFFRGLAEESWSGSGEANGSLVTVRALAWIVVGHAEHHLAVVRERYLG